jgi:heme exporter protein A
LAILGIPIRREPAIVGPPNCALPPLMARQLCCTLGGQLVLDRLDLTIAEGQIVALTGANGAGKTTLLRCLTGRLRPTSGEVLWFGQSPNRRPALHRLVGYVGHESLLYLELSARENLLFGARMHGLPDSQNSVDRMLAAAELEKQTHRLAGHLSKGMRQRLSLARALIHEPPIVILDEPFSNLDIDGRQRLNSWLRELRAARRAVLFSTHDAEKALQVADQTLDLHEGRLRNLHPLAPRRAA